MIYIDFKNVDIMGVADTGGTGGGTGSTGGLDWSEIGYGERPKSLADGFNYAKQIYNSWNNNTTSINYVDDIKLVYFPLVDTSNVTNMASAFYNCKSLQTIPLIDTSSVTTISNAFYGCVALQTIPAIDTSNVTDMFMLFGDCKSLQTIPSINTSNVTTVDYMFVGCTALESLPLLNFSNVETTSEFLSYSWDNSMMISNLEGFVDLHVNLDVSNCSQLTAESILNVINQAADLSETGSATLTLGTTNISKLTEEQIAIATAKGWTLA